MGVDGENAERNKRAILKHFRNLVDETASKASFLAAFTRTDSGKPDGLARGSEGLEGKDSEGLPGPSNAGSKSESDEAGSMEGDSREPSGNPGLDDGDDIELADAGLASKPSSGKSSKEHLYCPLS